MEMKLIAGITVPKYRQREYFDEVAIGKLRQSIVENGLLHAIVIRDDEDVLVAGENRLRAINDAHFLGETVRHGTQIVPSGYIPVLHLGALTEVQALEAELEENIRRTDLTWQEQMKATERLAELRKMQNAESPTPVSPQAVIQQLAREVQGDKTAYFSTVVQQQLMVARNLEAVPEAAKAKSLKEAVKLVKRSESRERYAAIGAEVAREAPASRHTLIHGDAQTVLLLDSHHGKYDIILSDPPYGMGADTFGDSGNADRSTGAHGYDDSYEAWLELMGGLIPLTWKVTKPDAHLYMFCDFDRFHELKNALAAVGWKVFRTPLIMHKIGNSGRVPWPKHGPRRQYELVLYAYRGDRYVNQIMHDVFPGPLVAERMGHPAEKPVEALKNLLQRSINPGDNVLDMCCGSGPIFEAVHELGGYCTGIEMDAAFYGMSMARKEGLK